MIVPTVTYSEEIKLNCKINLVTEYSDGKTERKNYVEVFSISEHNNFRSILPSSKNHFCSVTTYKSPFNMSIIDHSDESKWDITVNYEYPNGMSSTVSVLIDRNIGKVWCSDRTESIRSWMQRTGDGQCAIVDISKKKF